MVSTKRSTLVEQSSVMKKTRGVKVDPTDDSASSTTAGEDDGTKGKEITSETAKTSSVDNRDVFYPIISSWIVWV